jgi:hypothetical protein
LPIVSAVLPVCKKEFPEPCAVEPSPVSGRREAEAVGVDASRNPERSFAGDHRHSSASWPSRC